MNTIKYETGATSHAVNDLILFTDNTRELAEFRDSIYSKMAQFDLWDKTSDWDSIQFIKLIVKAKAAYYNEFTRAESKHISGMTNTEVREYCQLYLDDYPTWKKEHGY